MTVSRPRGPRGPAIHSPIETAPYWSDELARYQSECLEASHALLLGRVTYDGFAAAWPSRAGDPFADRDRAVLERRACALSVGMPRGESRAPAGPRDL